MSLILNLPQDLEEALKRRAADAGLDVSTYLTGVLQRQDLNDLEVPPMTPERLESFLRSMAEIHADAPATFDDNRESIYEGRGE